MSDPTPGATPRGNLLTRLYWIALGPALLVVFASLIAKHPTWSFGWRDALFWAALSGIVALRWMDVRFYAGHTADGAPATLDHVRRHGLIVAAVGALLWAGAHAIDV